MKMTLRSARGSELLEFAFVSVGFLATLFMILEGGRMIWEYNVIANSAKEGVRVAIVQNASMSDSAVRSAVQNYVQAHSYGLPQVTVTTSWPNGRVAGRPAQVRVQKPFKPVAGLLPSRTITLASTSQMIVGRR